MDTRVKERLTGAIVLVAIVVILVPALLSGPRSRPVAPDPLHSVTIDLSTDARGRVATPPAAAPSVAAPTSAIPAPALEHAPAPPASSPASAAPPLATAAPASVPAPAPAAAATAAAAATGWIVQLGSFASRENAAKLVKELRRKGYSAFVAEFRGSTKTLYRVRVGPEKERVRADALASRLAREGHPGSVAPQP
jgi:DedD protein